MKTRLLTPLGRDARQPLGYRKDGRPIYPIAGGDGRTPVLPRTVEDCIERMDEITAAVERLARFDSLTRSQEQRREELVMEFDELDAHRNRLRVSEALRSGGLGSVGDGGSLGGLGIEGGSPRGRDVAPEGHTGLRDQARRALDSLRSVPDEGRERLTGMFERCESARDGGTELNLLSRWLLATSAPAYARATAKLFADPENGHREFTGEELAAFRSAKEVQRAMSLTDGAGGFLVPTHLDPTIIVSGPGSVDPMRQVARVETVATDTWNGVSSAGVTASWDPESSEVSDDSPTLAGPSVPTFTARAFVAASLEVSMDANIGQQVAPLLADAKTQLESASFVKGTGAGQPQGVVTGLPAGSRVATAVADTLAVGDVTKPFVALPPRWQQNASAMANLATLTAISSFETAGGALRYPEVSNDRLLRKPLFEHSAMDAPGATATADNDAVLLVGDFRNYLVVDRVGLMIEYVPHLFGANGRPTGQRGWFAYWRSGGGRLVDDAFRLLVA
jgi:HK97 family phage major capsid protein